MAEGIGRGVTVQVAAMAAIHDWETKTIERLKFLPKCKLSLTFFVAYDPDPCSSKEIYEAQVHSF